MLGHLNIIDKALGATVAEELGMPGEATKMARMPIDLDPSPALRLYGKYQPTLNGRKVGVLLAPGFDPKVKNALIAAIKKECKARAFPILLLRPTPQGLWALRDWTTARISPSSSTSRAREKSGIGNALKPASGGRWATPGYVSLSPYKWHYTEPARTVAHPVRQLRRAERRFPQYRRAFRAALHSSAARDSY